jgi:hypothetical protein
MLSSSFPSASPQAFLHLVHRQLVLKLSSSWSSIFLLASFLAFPKQALKLPSTWRSSFPSSGPPAANPEASLQLALKLSFDWFLKLSLSKP